MAELSRDRNGPKVASDRPGEALRPMGPTRFSEGSDVEASLEDGSEDDGLREMSGSGEDGRTVVELWARAPDAPSEPDDRGQGWESPWTSYWLAVGQFRFANPGWPQEERTRAEADPQGRMASLRAARLRAAFRACQNWTAMDQIDAFVVAGCEMAAGIPASWEANRIAAAAPEPARLGTSAFRI